jgi:phosphoglucosamine mutase
MDEKLFGTDGIRAVAGSYPLDRPTVRVLGRALARLLSASGLEPRVLMGRDTRESGQWIEQAFTAGVLAGGGEAVSAGVIPTSAVSFLTGRHGFSAGVVFSASHNPFQDNGIKIFSPAGTKIPEEWEAFLERAVREAGPEREERESSSGSHDGGLVEGYLEHLKSRVRIPAGGKRGKVVLDCSNGAGSSLAPRIYEELGFEVVPIHASPDGRNINCGCGSLHPESLACKVVETGAVFGAAFDGDADRAVWADETGRVLNGDHTLFVQSLFMKETGRLRSDRVVATTMSNMGLEVALERAGLALVRTRVGDRYVLEEMVRLGCNLGGEQSGHTIFLDDLNTGDGILTSLKMLEAMVHKDSSLSELVRGLEEFPQVLVNVRVAAKRPFADFPEIAAAADSVRGRLGNEGRLDLRYSGTEPLARIMVEGRDVSEVKAMAAELAEVIKRHLGAPE